jgi:hypothetical protein
MPQGNGGQAGDTQRKLIFAVLGLAFLSLLYRLGVLKRTDPVSLLVVGVPTLLAVLVLLIPEPPTLSGRYLKWATVGLLFVGIVAGEAFVYLLLAAPVIYLAAYLLAKSREAMEAQHGAPAVAPAKAEPPAAPAAAEPEEEPVFAGLRRKQMVLLGIVLSFTIVSLVGRLVYATRMETSALMFVGVPTVLAIVLVLTVRPKSALGTAMTGVTFVLLLSAILFGEGLVCILMAAPIFYLIAAVVGGIIDASRRQSRKNTALCLLPVLLMSLEGAHSRLSFPREESVSARRVLAVQPEEVQAALAAPMNFHTPLPLYLKMGFPRPVATRGSGLAAGDQRVIHFAGGEGHPGDLVLQVTSTGPGGVKFRALSDHSKVAHWLDWEEAVVTWQRVDAQHTAVTWTLRYRRNVDPAWYFAPWERYAVGLADGYLIDNLATPAR